MISDSLLEQERALDELVEILSRRRRVTGRIEQNIFRVGRSARPLFSPQLHPYFDAIWSTVEQARRSAFRKFQEESQKILREIEVEFGPGTPKGDLIALVWGYFPTQEDEGTSIEIRDEVVFRVAKRMPQEFENPRAQRALRERAAARGKPPRVLIHDEILPAALVLAHDEANAPQRIRLGKRWLKDDDGNVAEVAPRDGLCESDCRKWLVQEAMRIAEQQVLGRGPPTLASEALEEAPTLALDAFRERSTRRSPFADPEVERRKGLMLADESDEENAVGVDDLLKRLEAVASPQERELIRLSCEENRSTADLAALLGVTETQVYVLRTRLRKKAKKISPTC